MDLAVRDCRYSSRSHPIGKNFSGSWFPESGARPFPSVEPLQHGPKKGCENVLARPGQARQIPELFSKKDPIVQWPRTLPFHGSNTGSNPVRVAISEGDGDRRRRIRTLVRPRNAARHPKPPEAQNAGPRQHGANPVRVATLQEWRSRGEFEPWFDCLTQSVTPNRRRRILQTGRGAA